MGEKVAILTNDLVKSNGAELVAMMQAQKLDADLWCLRYDEEVFPEIAETINIKEYGISLPADKPFSTTFNTISPVFARPTFLKDYDVVIAHQDLSEILAFRAKRSYGIKFIWYMHNSSDLLYRSGEMDVPIKNFIRFVGPPLRYWDEKAFLSADHVLANSEKTKRERVAPYFPNSEKVEVVYPPVREFRVYEEDGNYALMLSRVDRSKELGKAIDWLEGREEDILIGGDIEDKQYRKELEEKASNQDVNIEFLGFVGGEELEELIAKAKFGIHTAHEETFGLVPLEMINAGTPCYVYNTIGAAEVLPKEFILPVSDKLPSLPDINLTRDHFNRLRDLIEK